MSRTAQYVIFYAIAFLVLYGMHLYVYFRLKGLFGIKATVAQLCIVTALALSFPVCSLLEKFFTNRLSMLLYTASSTWLGIIFLALSALVAFEPIRPFFKADLRIAGTTIIALVLAASAYALVNAMVLAVRPVTIHLPGLSRPVNLVLLSDIHVGTIHNTAYLKRIVAKTNALDPDMVLIVGDLFDGIGPVTSHTVAPLKDLKAKTYFTIGNHEIYDGAALVTQVLADTPVTVLRNQVTEHAGIQIIGIDHPPRENQKDNPVIHCLDFDRNRPSILMYHTPSGIDDAVQAGVTLQLSGHTHNGQLFPFNLLVRLFYPYTNGLYHIGSLALYVSPGTGTWGPPMRMGSQNQITRITLAPL